MLFSNLFPVIKKDFYPNVEVFSNNLMLRAGLIDQLSSGVYIWLPLGLKVLRKLETVIRNEMNSIGYSEIFMPILQPSSLWRKTGRWDKFGSELFKVINRTGQEFCLGPTHEEVVTHLVSSKLNSYKDLPLKLYQIQTKFRDEIRPRFGVMRSREFLMKDAYSFHIDYECFKNSYNDMCSAYVNILNKLKLDFKVVNADSGNIGDGLSQEFHVLADCGEDTVVYSTIGDYSSNIELAERFIEPRKCVDEKIESIKLIYTPDAMSISDVSNFLNCDKKKILKTILVKGLNNNIVCLLLRGDHFINKLKVENTGKVMVPYTLVSEDEILNALGFNSGFIGPIGLNNVTFIADFDVLNMCNFVCGSNKYGYHYVNVNWNVDCREPEYIFDIRYVVSGDKDPIRNSDLIIKKGIEVGHIFELGYKYSDVIDAHVYDFHGKRRSIYMGCYGIGVTRLVAAVIEQAYDNYGIIWPEVIAPFSVVIVFFSKSCNDFVKEYSMSFYSKLLSLGVEVLIYDRDDHLSLILKNIDLIGIPHRVIINDLTVAMGRFEYKHRRDFKVSFLNETELLSILV